MMRVRRDVIIIHDFHKGFCVLRSQQSFVTSRHYLNCDLRMFAWCSVCVTMNVNKTNKNNPAPGVHGKFIRGNYFESHWAKLEPDEHRYQTS